MTTSIRGQKRGRRLAMTPAERNAFLAGHKRCRLATVDAAGRPHVSPLDYVWDGRYIWIFSLVRSQRWADVAHTPEVALVVDDGDAYEELRGVELRGVAEVVGEVPRRGEPVPELFEPERMYGQAFFDGRMLYQGTHAWLRITPRREYTWDFRKLTQGRSKV